VESDEKAPGLLQKLKKWFEMRRQIKKNKKRKDNYPMW